VRCRDVCGGVAGWYADGKSLLIELNSSVPNFISLLEIPIVGGAHPDAPSGTGPYKVLNNTSNKFMELTSFDNWWKEDKPFIKEINIRYMPDKNTFFFAYNANEINMVTARQSDLGKYNSNEKNAMALVPTNKFTFLGFNNSRSSLFSSELKQAVNFAIDKEKLSSTIFSGKVDFANTFINPRFNMASPEFKSGVFDSKKASDILKDYTGRKDFELIVNSDNENRLNVAYFIANSLKEAGINVNVRRLNWQEYETAIATGNFDAFLGEVSLTNNSNSDFLFKNGNLFNYSSDEMNEVLNSWQEQTTEAGLLGGYHFLENQYLIDFPFISLYFEIKSSLYNEKLTTKSGEFKPLPNNPYYDINYWYFK
jgi:peptide/nickel transport system substrate-binding protein